MKAWMHLPVGRVQYEFVLQMRALVVLLLPSFDPAKARPRGDGGSAMLAAPSVGCSWPLNTQSAVFTR